MFNIVYNVHIESEIEMKNFLVEYDGVTNRLNSKVIQGKTPKTAVEKLFPNSDVLKVTEDEFFLANFIVREVDIDHNLPKPKKHVHTCYYKIVGEI